MTSEKINVAEIINDINDVLSKHLVSIVNKCNNDKELYENYTDFKLTAEGPFGPSSTSKVKA